MGVWVTLCWTLKALCLDAEDDSSGLWSLLVRKRLMCGCHWPCAALGVAMCDTGGSPSDTSSEIALLLLCSQNPRMVWVGRNGRDHSVQPPLPWTRTLATGPGCSKALQPLLDISRDGATTAGLGNLCLITLTIKNIFLTFNLNLSSFNLQPFPISCHSMLLLKVPPQLSVGPLFTERLL